jgi:hypothetical protein
MVAPRVVLFSIMLAAVMVGVSDAGDPAGKAEYLTDCARCHGVDGRGNVPGMSAVAGYISVDLTQLSNQNDGQFPHRRVYEAIDGRQRPPHLIGDMPAWGLNYSQARLGAASEEEVKRKISALVDYLESIQEKRPRERPMVRCVSFRPKFLASGASGPSSYCYPSSLEEKLLKTVTD